MRQLRDLADETEIDFASKDFDMFAILLIAAVGQSTSVQLTGFEKTSYPVSPEFDARYAPLNGSYALTQAAAGYWTATISHPCPVSPGDNIQLAVVRTGFSTTVILTERFAGVYSQSSWRQTASGPVLLSAGGGAVSFCPKSLGLARF